MTAGEPLVREARRWSIAYRILAVNLFALLMLAGSIFYLDSFRDRLLEERRGQAAVGAELVADSLAEALEDGVPDGAGMADRIGRATQARLRVYDAKGELLIDSWRTTGPTFELRDPMSEPWTKHAARALDRFIEFVGSAPAYPSLIRPGIDSLRSWPEGMAATPGHPAVVLRRAPDRTVIVSAAARVPRTSGLTLMMTLDTRDITRVVRAERLTSFLIFLGILGLSLFLSFFLARTIVRPLRRLSLAAQRVRLGRSREVTVPRFTKRRDEIGLLARALSDMTQALRQRMDSTEAFAADVAHELKNPLASLQSAVEILPKVSDPAMRAQLLDVLADDVRRIDRLITDIADVSRLDGELARSRFERIDFGEMVDTLIHLLERNPSPRGVEIAYARPEAGTATLFGDESRLSQLARNLIDNALSFSPDAAVVTVVVQRVGGSVMLRVDDDGPGLAPESIPHIFKRFYSERPQGEAFGKHSGLGLAIARAVVEAHDGTIEASNREENGNIAGARFIVMLPAAGMSRLLHATAIAIGGRCVLLTGAPGSGKSDLAMRLIDRGAVLVGDDYVDLTVEANCLIARGRETIAGQIEVRGVGIVAVPHAATGTVALLIDLEGDVERLPGSVSRDLCGATIPAIALNAFEASAPLKVEAALRRFGLALDTRD